MELPGSLMGVLQPSICKIIVASTCLSNILNLLPLLVHYCSRSCSIRIPQVEVLFGHAVLDEYTVH